jgi:hypothetical protein
MTVGAVEPGSTDTTVVHGFVLVEAGCAHPAIGAPTRSGSHMMLPPEITASVWWGMSTTRPPWEHMMVALLVTIGGNFLPLPGLMT